MDLAVCIPVMREDLALDLLGCIERQTVKPDVIIIVDNSGGRLNTESLSEQQEKLLIIPPRTPMSVNECWNTFMQNWFKAKTVAILNDDLVLHPMFFERMVRGLKDKVGVVSPHTMRHQTALEKFNWRMLPPLQEMTRREGWAFAMRFDLLSRIPPIPSRLSTFFGDDWIWHWTHKGGYTWSRTDALCYHYGGSSLRIRPEIRETLNAERKIFRELIKCQ